MDARDICRRLNCSPVTLSEWVDQGCPIQRHPPFAGFDINSVRSWLAQNNIHDWPRESDEDVGEPIRAILKALSSREITPWQAEKIIMNLGSGHWG